MVLGSILLLLAALRTSSASDCTTACDVSYPNGPKVRFCGTDQQNYEANYQAVSKHCYFNCGVSAYYQGSCGCPNDCHADFNRGSCVNSQCECSSQWGGQDCSLPTALNDCSLHGKLSLSSNSPTGVICECDSGFTGSDCSTRAFPLGTAPWGDLYPDNKEYHGDTYGDAHPLFNITNMAAIYLSIDEGDYLSQLYPWNCYNASYVPAQFYFDNHAASPSDRIQTSFGKVGLRIKGAWSRMDLKKGFNIKFDKYVTGQSMYEMSKISLKPGADDDDTFVKNMLYTNMQRAVEVPVQRASYTLLYINGRYNGLYFMHEDVDQAFISGRYKDDHGTGNLFKMCSHVNLRYYGDDVTTYQNTYSHYPNGQAYNSYELASSLTDDWTDLVQFLGYVNQTSDEDFAEQIESRIDVAMILRGLVVESFLLGADGFIKGQNYYFYHSDVKSTPLQWSLFNDDFDQEFYSDAIGVFKDETDIFSYCVRSPTDGDYNPLLTRLFAIKKYRDQFIDYYQTFLSTLFGSKSVQQPSDRFSSIYEFVLQWVAKDKLWQISEGVNTEHFILVAQNTTVNLNYRYHDTWKQVQNYLQQ